MQTNVFTECFDVFPGVRKIKSYAIKFVQETRNMCRWLTTEKQVHGALGLLGPLGSLGPCGLGAPGAHRPHGVPWVPGHTYIDCERAS